MGENEEHYIIKAKPEDFLVREVAGKKLKSICESGEFMIFLLRKREYNTETAVQRIADALGIARKNIGYAGSKDRQAITEQYISIRGVPKEKVQGLNLKEISLEFVGFSKEKISLGELECNEFNITVRNITKPPRQLSRIVNYFGKQRFSTNNAEIGQAIIKKDFKKAVEILLEHAGKEEGKIRAYLAAHRNDFVGALKTIPWKNLTLYVHAYQSKLWNNAAKKLMDEEPAIAGETASLPIVGFATELADDKASCIIKKIMEEENVTQQDFVIRAIPELSVAGDERKLFAEISNLTLGELEDDDLNPGKKKLLLKFSLGKGSYATEAIRMMFN